MTIRNVFHKDYQLKNPFFGDFFVPGVEILNKNWIKMYDVSKSVLNERRVSDYVTYGEGSVST